MLHSTVVYVFDCQTKNPWSEFGRTNKFNLKYIWCKNLPNQQCSNPLWIREWLKVAFSPFLSNIMVHAPYKQMLVMYLSCGTQMGSASVQQHEMWSTSGLCTCDKTERYWYYFLTLRLHTKSNQQKKKKLQTYLGEPNVPYISLHFLAIWATVNCPQAPHMGPGVSSLLWRYFAVVS